ncbi:conserved hypothetical protein [Hahella chejuensis KCTC 2396]|uniref:Peptidase C80 domain-containing protein n=1 Tax=Hahella chejuensis (strain KCTC 2396) TaxID=349521 RepID=Q2SAY5_HAHCH|nr:C80 family cysteine peptidase [Hahella chejuensis]ABC32189.1 conserved hypothetical protein [Hahella chejuensis KCTC 2396]
MNYDKQLIIVLLTEPKDNLRSFGRNLYRKHPDKSELVEYDVASKTHVVINSAGLGALTENSRIQIVGHGDLNGVSCAGKYGKALATFIANKAAPGLKQIKKISLTVCYAAGNATQPNFDPANSFAAAFHYSLKQEHGVIADVTARPATMIVNAQGQKETRFNYGGFGERYQHQGDNTKYLFHWNGSSQVITNVREPVDMMEIC